MSEKKRKPKEIHVDKLIIKADKVVIENEGRPDDRPYREEVDRDPWGFPFRPMMQREEERGEEEQSEEKENNEGGERDRDRDDRRRPWF